MSAALVSTPAQLPVGSTATLPEKPAGSASYGEAAKQFEGMLMSQIFQVMRKTVQHSNLFGGSDLSRSTYEYLLDQAVVQHAMDSGKGWGLAPRLEEAWKARSEKSQIGA